MLVSEWIVIHRHTHLGGERHGGLRREHFGRRHGGAEGEGRGHHRVWWHKRLCGEERTTGAFVRVSLIVLDTRATVIGQIAKIDPPGETRGADELLDHEKVRFSFF